VCEREFFFGGGGIIRENSGKENEGERERMSVCEQKVEYVCVYTKHVNVSPVRVKCLCVCVCVCACVARVCARD